MGLLHTKPQWREVFCLFQEYLLTRETYNLGMLLVDIRPVLRDWQPVSSYKPSCKQVFLYQSVMHRIIDWEDFISCSKQLSLFFSITSLFEVWNNLVRIKLPQLVNNNFWRLR